MLAQGYPPEDDNIVCVLPVTTTRTTAEGFWVGTTNTGRTLIVVVLDDGYFAAIYTPPGQPFVFAGAVQGSSTSVNGVFTSVDGKDFSFLAHQVAAGSVTGNYTPKDVINGTLQGIAGPESFTVNYNATYDQPRRSRRWQLVHGLDVVGRGPAARDDDDLGRGRRRRRHGRRLRVQRHAAPRGNVNLYNVGITFGGGACGILGTSTLTLIGYYEPTLRRAVIAGPNVGRSDFVLYDLAKP
jgi:hypothetical protein